MTFFWTSRENMPDGFGFSLYHWQHLLWIIGIAAVIVGTARMIPYFRKSQIRHLLQTLVWTCVGLELMRDLILLGTGQFRVAYLPLDLCGLSIFWELAAVYWKNVWLRECVYCLSLPGACLALIFPNWNKLPMLNYFSIHGFVLHGILVLVPILLCASGEIRPQINRLPFCFVCIALTCIPVALFNQHFGTNFFFLSSPSKGSPLVWFEQIFGNHLIGFPILMGIIWTGMYGSVAIIRFRKKRNLLQTNTSANHNM